MEVLKSLDLEGRLEVGQMEFRMFNGVSFLKQLNFARIISILLAVLCLSGCGLDACFHAEDIDKDIRRFVLPASGPPDIVISDPSTYWAKTGIYISDASSGIVKQTVRVTSSGATLCAGVEKIIVVTPGTFTHKLGFSVFPNDKIKISTSDKLGIISKDMCENKDPSVYIEDKDKCISEDLSSTYAVEIGNDLTPSSNRFYPKEVDFNKHPEYWYEGALHAKLNLDTVTKNPDSVCLKNSEMNSPLPYAFCAKYFLTRDFLASGTKCSDNQTTYKIEMSDIKKNDTYSVNSDCGNICGLEKDCAGDQNKCKPIINDHCAFTKIRRTLGTPSNVKTLADLEANYVTYIPYLKVVMKPSGIEVPMYNDTAIGVSGMKIAPFEYLGSDTVDSLETTLGGNAGTSFSEQRGGYTLSVTKDCSEETRKSLYYMVSDKRPTVLPGEQGTTNIDFVNASLLPLSPSARGDLYVAVLDKDKDYRNNRGAFTFEYSAMKEQSKVISSAVGRVKKYVMIALYGPGYDNFFKIGSSGTGAVGSIFNTLTRTSFLTIVKALLAVYVTVYSAFFFAGVKKLSIAEVFIMVCKVGVIVTLLSPGSWEFFNKHMFMLFSQAPSQLIDAISNRDLLSSGGFDFLDRPFYRFTFSETWYQIMGLIFAGPFGWFAVVLIMWSLWVLFSSVFELIITYFISLIMVGLLLSLAPFFLSMILFQRTKSIFDMWVAALSQNAMHPVVMCVSFAFMSEIVSGIAYSVFSYDVCSGCVAKAKIDFGFTSVPLCLVNFLLPVGYSPGYTVADYNKLAHEGATFMGVPIDLAKVLMLVISAHAMKHTVSFAGNVVLSIFGVVASDLSHVGHAASEGMLGLVGMDKESRDRRAGMEHHREKSASKASPAERAERKTGAGKEEGKDNDKKGGDGAKGRGGDK